VSSTRGSRSTLLICAGQPGAGVYPASSTPR
jgi:hypothetical protein